MEVRMPDGDFFICPKCLSEGNVTIAVLDYIGNGRYNIACPEHNYFEFVGNPLSLLLGEQTKNNIKDLFKQNCLTTKLILIKMAVMADNIIGRLREWTKQEKQY